MSCSAAEAETNACMISLPPVPFPSAERQNLWYHYTKALPYNQVFCREKVAEKFLCLNFLIKCIDFDSQFSKQSKIGFSWSIRLWDLVFFGIVCSKCFSWLRHANTWFFHKNIKTRHGSFFSMCGKRRFICTGRKTLFLLLCTAIKQKNRYSFSGISVQNWLPF